MGTFTNFIKLHKPAENEKYTVNIFNANAELIDSALGRMEQDNENRDNLLDTLNTKADGITSALISAWNTVANKVDKVAGKGLSTHDYTTEEKDKLNGIEPGANANVQADWNVSDTDSDAYIKNKPDLTSYTPSVMTGATASAAGSAGSAPAPAMGKHNAYLRGDGTWQETSTSLTATVPGVPLDHTAAKVLKDQIDEQNSNLSELGTVYNNFTSDMYEGEKLIGGNFYNLCHIVLGPGTYIVTGKANIVSNELNSIIQGFYADGSRYGENSVNTKQRYIESIHLFNLSKATTIYLRGYISSTLPDAGAVHSKEMLAVRLK